MGQGWSSIDSGGGGLGGYSQIEYNETNLPQRSTLNFTGAGVVVTDDGIKTEVSIQGGGSMIVGENYVVVYAGDDWTKNADELQRAYNLAKTLIPNEQPIDATNRVTVICYAGYYDFRGNVFKIDTDFIDIVSITGNCDVNLISNGTLAPIDVQVKNDVFIKGINTLDAPFSINTNTSKTHIFENCKGGSYSFGFFDNASFPIRVDVGGTFIDCVGGFNSFGSQCIASGTFTNCTAQKDSFGGGQLLSADATGVFTNCVAEDNSFGVGGICTGRFINCTAINQFGQSNSFGFNCAEITNVYFENCKGGEYSFCSSNIGNITSITLTGDIINCTAGDFSFGYGYETANCQLNFDSCIGNDYCFIVNMLSSNQTNKTVVNCTARDYSFGYGTSGDGVKHNFYKCTGRDFCFSGYHISNNHIDCFARNNSFQQAGTGISYSLYSNCIAGSNSFGSVESYGNYNNCVSNDNSFGGSSGIAGGRYYYCRADSDSFASDITGTLSGKLYYCEMNSTPFGIVVLGSGRTFYCVGNDIPNNQ